MGQGELAKACISERIPCQAFTVTDAHAKHLELLLTEFVLGLMKTEGSSFYRAAAAGSGGGAEEQAKRKKEGDDQEKKPKKPKTAPKKKQKKLWKQRRRTRTKTSRMRTKTSKILICLGKFKMRGLNETAAASFNFLQRSGARPTRTIINLAE
jgi:hypothetical protein